VIQSIGIVGAGQMGAGIAQVAAQSGYEVCVSDVSAQALKKGQDTIKSSLARFVEKGKLSAEEALTIQEKIQWSDSLAHLAKSQLVVEAVSEQEALKKKIFATLDEQLPSNVILASNTSSISITRLAAITKRPERFIGMHFMNPVPLMKLVEIICGLSTSPETFEAVKAVAEKMGKVTTKSADYPGFIANRILMPMINEAFCALMEGLASAEDIDVTMQLGTNHPMGPLKLADFIGLDTCLSIMEVLHHGMGDGKYRPCPLLRKYVDAGRVGK
jgi:3-hydroxybutyryl-CoA dehydrogenase